MMWYDRRARLVGDGGSLSNDASGAVQLFVKKHGSRTDTQSSMLCSKWNWNDSHSHSERADKLLQGTVISFVKQVQSFRIVDLTFRPLSQSHVLDLAALHWLHSGLRTTLGEEKIEVTRTTIGACSTFVNYSELSWNEIHGNERAK